MIAKFRYHRENSVIAKIENFAMHSNFRYDSEFSSIEKFWHCSLPNVPLLLAATHLIHVFLLSFLFMIFFSSYFVFVMLSPTIILHAWNDSTNLALKACKNCKISHEI